MTRTIPLTEKPRLMRQGQMWKCYGMSARPFWPWREAVAVVGEGHTLKGAYMNWLWNRARST